MGLTGGVGVVRNRGWEDMIMLDRSGGEGIAEWNSCRGGGRESMAGGEGVNEKNIFKK